MTKEQFDTAVQNIGYAYDHRPAEQFYLQRDKLWNELQKSKKTMQRSYQRRIKALTEQD